MAKAKKISAEEAMQDLKSRKHHVEEATAASMIKKYQSFRTKMARAKNTEGPVPPKSPDLPIAITYNKKAIQRLLKQPGTEGIRIFPAINADNMLTLVLVAIDAAGETIKSSAVASKSTTPTPGTTTVDEGQMSPPYPAP